MSRRDPVVQECIDFLTRHAGQLRQERGPEDPDLWRVSKAIAALLEPRRRQGGGKGHGRRVKAHTVNGVAIVVTKDMLEGSDER